MHKHLLASAAGSCEPPTSPAALPPPQSSRILRILRLLKVTRLLRHQLLRRMEDSWGLNHGYVALAKFSAGTLLLAHWMGCALALVLPNMPEPTPMGSMGCAGTLSWPQR